MLEPGTVARLAVPTLAQDLLLDPESGVPVVQKLLGPADIHALLAGGEPRISGYCHHALDVSHIATPAVLADAAGQPDMINAAGSVNLLRWPASGSDLYRTPYGGIDEESRDAVAGWVVEEPPFVGWAWCPTSTRSSASTRSTASGCRTAPRSWSSPSRGPSTGARSTTVTCGAGC